MFLIISLELRNYYSFFQSHRKVGFFKREGLLYRRWISPGRDMEEKAVEQLVCFPLQCRETVLKQGHEIPLAGHLGRHRTACISNLAEILLAYSITVKISSVHHTPPPFSCVLKTVRLHSHSTCLFDDTLRNVWCETPPSQPSIVDLKPVQPN